MQDQNDYLREFLTRADRYLFLLLERKGRATPKCTCGSPAVIRCQDCIPGPVWCQRCCRENHRHLPFHRLQRWNKKFFAPTSLADIGYVLYLGHGGHPCPESIRQVNNGQDKDLGTWVDDDEDISEDEGEGGDVNGKSGTDQGTMDGESFDIGFHDAQPLSIVHLNGVHNHKVLACSCSAQPLDEQFFTSNILPSTWRHIRTGFTLEMLDDFLLSSVEGKVSIAGYWGKIVRLTNNCFPHNVPVRERISISEEYLMGLTFVESISRVWKGHERVEADQTAQRVWLRTQRLKEAFGRRPCIILCCLSPA